ncbi:MAG: type IV pilus twitching motility protein PilT [Nitrospirae bacterium YQR-1]
MLYLAPNDSPYIRAGNTLSKVGKIAPLNEKMTEEIVDLLISRAIIKVEKPITESRFNYESKEAGSFKVLVTLGCNGYMLSVSPVFEEIPDIDALDLPQIIKDLAKVQSGLILVIGKNNSGKSATVASYVDFINKNYNRRIVVIEEPALYYHKSWLSIVKQPFVRLSEISDISKTFDNAIGAASVLAIDGLPMYETMKLSLAASGRGLLVIAAVGGGGGISETLRLMIDCFPKSHRKDAKKTLSTTLKAVLWQNLLPKNDAAGVIPVFEILLNDPVISALLFNEEFHLLRPVMAAGSHRGMKTITQALAEMTNNKLINKEAAEKFRNDTYSYYVNPVKEAYY